MNPDPEGVPVERLPSISLKDWWRTIAEGDLQKVMPKVQEYTSADLQVMGAVMEQWGLTRTPDVEAVVASDYGGMEAACAWYILGKVARCVAAYREGRLPSEDTLEDITIYSLMMRRIRETGRWP